MRHQCYFCHVKTIEKLINKFQPDQKIADQFAVSVHKLLGNCQESENPYLAAGIHRIARKYLNHSDLYKNEKVEANDLLLKFYDYWLDLVNKSSNPFYTAAKLAVIGNIIDYGAHTVSEDILAQVESYLEQDLKIGETVALSKQIETAKSILYLGDNAGEIVFDKLFIEIIGPEKVTFVVRGEPVINDVTTEDARQCGLDKICRIISNGNDAPSTLLEFCSDEFVNTFNDADLIISKGQGNFEGLIKNKHPNLFFMLIAKCNPIAEILGVNCGDMIITKNKS